MLVTQLDVLDHGATDVLAPACEWRVEVQRQPALAKRVADWQTGHTSFKAQQQLRPAQAERRHIQVNLQSVASRGALRTRSSNQGSALNGDEAAVSSRCT